MSWRGRVFGSSSSLILCVFACIPRSQAASSLPLRPVGFWAVGSKRPVRKVGVLASANRTERRSASGWFPTIAVVVSIGLWSGKWFSRYARRETADAGRVCLTCCDVSTSILATGLWRT